MTRYFLFIQFSTIQCIFSQILYLTRTTTQEERAVDNLDLDADSDDGDGEPAELQTELVNVTRLHLHEDLPTGCLLYTSDAADE